MTAKVVNPINLTALPQVPSSQFARNTVSDKIILPPSVLQNLLSKYASELESAGLPSPLLFQITNTLNGKFTHVGVLEFSAEESTVLIPPSVQRNLGISDASNVLLSFKVLPKASSITIVPLESYDDEIDWKYLLEARFRSNRTALTVGDIIDVAHPSNPAVHYSFKIHDAQPENAVCIVDTDVDLNIVNPAGAHHISSSSPNYRAATPVTTTYPTTVSPGSTAFFQNVSLNTDLKITLQGPLPSSFGISASEPVEMYVGVDDDTSSKAFLQTNLTSSKPDLLINLADFENAENLVLVLRSTAAKTFELRVTPQDTKQEVGANSKTCPNCKQSVPVQSFQLHTTFCQRNNILCDCGQVFSRRSGIPASHWHCSQCQETGDSSESHDLHNRLMHIPQSCECDSDIQFPSFVDLARHRATDCPLRLHICRFCHLKLPREKASPVDVLQGLSGHESYCGNKTADCPNCGRAVRLRDVESHMSYHTMSRINKTADPICSNFNCVRPVSQNNMDTGLCGTCFGPLHSTLQDPSGQKLAQRIERKYVIQLTGGCGKPWCLNEYCATAAPAKRPMSETIKLAKSLVDLAISQHKFYFCVDEAVTKRKLFVDFESENNVYDYAWLCMAIDKAWGNESQARQWLELHSPKKSELAQL